MEYLSKFLSFGFQHLVEAMSWKGMGHQMKLLQKVKDSTTMLKARTCWQNLLITL